LAAARVSHRPRRDFLAGESIPSLLLDGIEGFAPGLPCFELPSASRSTHPCSPDHPHLPKSQAWAAPLRTSPCSRDSRERV
jgi:hypothetical protein